MVKTRSSSRRSSGTKFMALTPGSVRKRKTKRLSTKATKSKSESKTKNLGKKSKNDDGKKGEPIENGTSPGHSNDQRGDADIVSDPPIVSPKDQIENLPNLESNQPNPTTEPASHSNVDEDDDEEFPSLKHLFTSSEPARKRYKRGDVVMVKFGKFPRWPYIVGNMSKKGRASLFELPRTTMPIPKGSRPEMTADADKLERYREVFCDLVENYRIADWDGKLRFDFALQQAGTIMEKKMDAFVDSLGDADAELLPFEFDDALSADEKKGRSESSDTSDDDAITIDDISATPLETEPSVSNEEYISKEGRRRCDMLLEAVCSEKTQTHLLQVLRKEVRSDFRDDFIKLQMEGKLSCRYRLGFPFQEEEHLGPAMDFVYDLRRKYAPKLYGPNGDSYATSVLLPEAIKFGLRSVWKLTQKETAEIMRTPLLYFSELELTEI